MSAAIRVRKRVKGEMFAVHFLTDSESTRCGLDVDTLQIVEELDLDRLPQLEGCMLCARTAGDDRIERFNPQTLPAASYVLPASKGRISKTGKLRQTGRSGHGNKIR